MNKLEYQIEYLQDHRKACIKAGGVNWYVIDAIDLAIQIMQQLRRKGWVIGEDGIQHPEHTKRENT